MIFTIESEEKPKQKHYCILFYFSLSSKGWRREISVETSVFFSTEIWTKNFTATNHQTFQVPKMEVRNTSHKLYGYGLCKGKPTPRIAKNKVQYETLHFRNRTKFLVTHFFRKKKYPQGDVLLGTKWMELVALFSKSNL